MVVNPILFFDDKVQDYIEKIGNNIAFYSKFYMVLLYDDTPKSEVVKEALEVDASEINRDSGIYYVLTYMYKLPDCILNDEDNVYEQLISEFQNYKFDDVFLKMRWIATRFGVKNSLPVLLIASRGENGCIPIKLSEKKHWTEINGTIGYITEIFNRYGAKNLLELKEIIKKNGIECKFRKSDDNLANIMVAIRDRKKPSELIEEIFEKYRIGRGNTCLMTEKELANRIGISQKQLLSWKSDQSTPSRENILKFANCIGLLDIEINDLLEVFGYRSLDKSYKEDNELYNKYINKLID